MNIILGVTGSVAATLTVKLVRQLTELGKVHLVTTEHGRYFFNPTELPRECVLWNDHDEWWVGDFKKWTKKGDPIPHIDLRDEGDILVIAPLTANTLAKLCHGICDNLLTSIYRAWNWNKPVVVAPAMNTHMWLNPPTPKQVTDLRIQGVQVVDPVSKELACGDEGPGAMAHIDDIVAAVKTHLPQEA